MLNMDRMVGTITPKKVFSLRGSLVGVFGVDSGEVWGAMPHTVVIVSPQSPEGSRGVCSLDIVIDLSL